MVNADLTGTASSIPPPRRATPAAGSASGTLRVRAVRPGDGVVVVQVLGELDLAARHLLAEPVRQRLAGTAAMVVLDLSQINFINSDGVCALLELSRLAEARHKELVLVPSPSVDRLLRLLGLAGRFNQAASPESPARR
ncbi:STAS domain-containing protein [Saccharopolyspora mangrovi]|uniref:STAS domain-containing protein n=1 Tax=Saccharopolyspora mangrovi TaxID=3082379 RepID=A0ABU6ACM9_9PSEU|nr:STAS domain-containing protein [Saccharopolyspora sp. S2-29]MEB3369226.1 STAS domain-containing protein [Saccharopolyspora sp. S2-29]